MDMATAGKAKLKTYVPIDKRDQASVRAVILARTSNPGARDDDVETQVSRAEELIARKGWRLVRDRRAFAEKRSGRRNVERPVLDAVLALAQHDEIDVIVCSEFERVSRVKMRRWAAIATALEFGVEFRFANLLPNGKLPDTREGRMYLSMAEEFGEMEAERIRERTEPGLARRRAAGLPGSGSAGPPYGYKWRPKGEGQRSYTAYDEDKSKADILRDLYRRVDTDERASLRRLAQELDGRGIPTPSGRGKWTATTIDRMLRNPIYCGRGRLLRWKTWYEPEQNDETHRVKDQPKRTDRLRDKKAWAEETLPFAPGAVPVLVEPELWERVVRKLDERKRFAGKLGRAGSPHGEMDTLLHHGL